MRDHKQITLHSVEGFKTQLLAWAQQFEDIVWLDSNQYLQPHSSYDSILAVDAFTGIQTDYVNGFQKLKEYQSITNDWIFGYLSYDLKNDTEPLSSQNFDGLNFPDLCFFQPKRLFLFREDKLTIRYLNVVSDEVDADLKSIETFSLQNNSSHKNDIQIESRISKKQYINKVSTLLSHIHRGDIYEANFCQEFYAHAEINSLETYFKLNKISQPPFATFLKTGDKYLLSSSPERYLKKVGLEIMSQPIKGTTRRSEHLEEDADLKTILESDPKERSENIMIVDLVRNDLSKIAQKGTVNVTELCQIYSFKQVHHMISTVQAKALPTILPVDIIAATFPMGSMTGAPKISAMKIIEALEATKRGLYSGTVGYFTPEGDFDFNVVIRSILYNASKSYVSFSVGSAITSKSTPENEYEECLVKAKAMRSVLEN
ncbi:MAG: anthranilate synthase component I family protein [Flavobacteriaceae bacterium]|nr:anthranilate synthase component I family protein [Flavobacteriaceae bacterium]MDG1285181.1 anthranilate synthase component I family protein [Flavobacteriaceae bacterium]